MIIINNNGNYIFNDDGNETPNDGQEQAKRIYLYIEWRYDTLKKCAAYFYLYLILENN